MRQGIDIKYFQIVDFTEKKIKRKLTRFHWVITEQMKNENEVFSLNVIS